jgi:two-component system nitrate/nitrite response regulator NarL
MTSKERAFEGVGVVDFSARPVALFRVVVINDAIFERRLLRAWLESSGHFVVVGEASDGASGVPLVVELEPQLVVLGFSKPEGNGVGTLTRLVALSSPPVVVVYSELLPADLGGALRRSGAAACFDNNVGLASLTDELVRVIEMSPRDRKMSLVSPELTKRDHPMLSQTCSQHGDERLRLSAARFRRGAGTS